MRRLTEIPLFTLTKNQDDLASKVGSFNIILNKGERSDESKD